MHPQRIKTMAGGTMNGIARRRRMKAGFLGPLLGFAAPILSSIFGGLFKKGGKRRPPSSIMKKKAKKATKSFQPGSIEH